MDAQDWQVERVSLFGWNLADESPVQQGDATQEEEVR